MTLIELIERQRAQIATRLAERQTHTDAIAAVRSAVDAAGERDLTAAETATVTAADQERTRLDAEIDQLKARLATFESEQRADDAATALQAQTGGTVRAQAVQVGGASVSREPRTYTAQSANEGVSFFRDALASTLTGDIAARERQTRHYTESVREGELSQRAVATSGLGGLVVPQYLVDLAALPLRNGRPFANLIPSLQLPPDGMNLVIPRITGGVTTAAQATQNANVSSTDIAETDLTVPIVTIAGQQDLSRQTLERGSNVDAIVYRDLAAAYASELDAEVLNGAGTGGTMLGILKTSGTSAATAFGAVLTAANFYTKISGQIAAVAGAGAGVDADLIVMHPRRWGWYLSQSDTTGRPLGLSLSHQPYNASAINLAPGQSGNGEDPITGAVIVGSIAGIPVVTDNNIPITAGTLSEDQVIVLDHDQALLWEDGNGAPKQFRLEQTLGNQLTVKLVAYGYCAFTAGRYPVAFGKVGGLDATAGNGLIAPTF